MIKVNDLSVNYGDSVAVEKLNVAISQGEKVSIVGQSGCGKTSLLHALAGLVIPNEGIIRIFNQEIKGIRENTAIILQKDGLFPWKNVFDNVALGLINDNETVKEKTKYVWEVLDELGILDHKDKYLHELSGGQRQRAAIARALVQKPDLLLMDEPTGALDMITKEKFQDSLHELYDRYEITAVLVTHDIEEAVFLGQRILVMKEGKLVSEVINHLYGEENVRDSIEFYQLCLKVRQVMKDD